MGTRAATLLLLAVLTACSGEDDGDPPPAAQPTTDADCATVLGDEVFTTLGWTEPQVAEATVRGCHRDAAQGYVEVRERSGYERLCATLDRTGGVGPGAEVDWLEGRTACAVEPADEVGSTRVVVRGEGSSVTLVTVAVLSPTPRAAVRAAVALVVGAS